MKIHLHLGTSIVVLLLFIAVGSYTYQNVEGWNAVDSTYFVVITMTTIGYGDLAPQTDVGKIFTIFFSFFGIAMAFYFVSIIGSFIFEKQLNRKVDQIKHSFEKKEEEKKKKTKSKKKK